MLHEILRPELIKIGLDAEKKRETISELMDILIQYHDVPMKHRGILLDGLYANEDSLGSGMARGIAVPHLATDLVEDVICTIGISAKGIPFRSLDDKVAKVVVLLLVPKKDFLGEVQAIRGVQHLLESEELLIKLIKSVGPQEAYTLIEAAEDGQ
tara:strand:+ start:175 stop:639 length:465 start_codon:yes stop_codon:yes gene_type:complete